MNKTLFVTVSSIEWFSLFCLIFTMFRFRMKDHILQIIFASVIMSQFSFLIAGAEDISVIAPVLQFFIVFLFLWLMFRIHIFYAAVMTTFGYGWFLFIQTVLALVVESYPPLYLIQLGSSAFILFLCMFSSRYRLGFSFIPDNHHIKLNLKGENLRLLVLVILTAITISIYYLFVLEGFLLLTFFIMLLILGLFLYSAIKKEKEMINEKYY
ncbi:MAG TPA: hypothetical protein VGE40_09600 [Bacilli bacterium]